MEEQGRHHQEQMNEHYRCHKEQMDEQARQSREQYKKHADQMAVLIDQVKIRDAVVECKFSKPPSWYNWFYENI